MYFERIKQLREENKLTQKQLAEALSMQLTQYRRYESGERSIPAEILIALADFYGVTLDYIAGREENRESTNECKRIG